MREEEWEEGRGGEVEEGKKRDDKNARVNHHITH